jgi:hypothetical protein
LGLAKGSRLLRVRNLTEQDVLLASTSRTALKAGLYSARIEEAAEKLSKRGNPMIELLVAVQDGAGGERKIPDYLVDTDMGAAKLRSAVIAVAALDAYEAGSISPEMFPGKDVIVRLSVQKQRGFPDRNFVESYKSAASVMQLRPSASPS